MDADTRFLLREFKSEIYKLERRIEKKLDTLHSDLDMVLKDLELMKAQTNDLKYFKAKVLGGSAVVAFLIATAITMVFN